MAVDHTYIDDVVAGILLALDRKEHPFDAYNIASGRAPTLAEIVEIIRELVPGAEISVGPEEFRHGLPGAEVPAVPKGALDITRAREVLGYAPRFD
ncbi:MAG TPA: NAD(P)-dependent oxidoreductase, partial [Alphaproteobacteria bacterium]|nr:NAD(P)-dependent oxidoreductase [Alphaproteobacteria bacterium]